MNTIVVLMALLLLSYLGSFLASGRGLRATAGLPSGSELIVLGIVAGPLVFGAVTRSSLESFDPLLYVATGWIALSIGLNYGHVDDRRVPLGRMVAGISLSLLCGGIVAAGVWLSIPFVVTMDATSRMLLAGGMGAACAETTRLAIQWVVERYDAKGPLTELLSDLSQSDEVVPIGVLALLYSLRPPAHATVHLPPLGWAGATVVVGVLLGIATAALLARDLRTGESWGTILGTSLMTIGLAARLDLAAITAMFSLGATIAVGSRHQRDIQQMVSTTERAVMMPALVLAGARIDPSNIGRLGLLIPVALLLRFGAKFAVGFALRSSQPVAKGAPALLGLGLVSSGGMTICIGLALALRFPGAVGDTVLATAVAVTLAGELAGPLALRRVLVSTGEIVEPAPISAPPDEEPEDHDELPPDEEHPSEGAPS
ncbi:MAG: potassium transporter Kef [Myxococcales bacterium]|nr:potassium transporter Kef [Myxococcales bacterium]